MLYSTDALTSSADLLGSFNVRTLNEAIFASFFFTLIRYFWSICRESVASYSYTEA